ncbi:MAG: anhydro-N-acetylmuramic acid kinase, partial [Calditrichaeota bacterium]|nr:anhydro-N-acetylmuramic acid kinase [Calditrichota bacterium]
FDLRAADLAGGGEGAPITPLADYILFRDTKETRYIVNLGGFCNVTALSQGLLLENKISGKDLCACNQLLDKIAANFFHKPFDTNGFQAKHGSVQSESFEKLLELLTSQSNAKRSLGTGDEIAAWIRRFSSRHIGADIARTACAAIAETIMNYCESADRIILAGGGVMNKTLLREIRKRFDIPVDLSDEHGIPAQYREAVAMAVLGALCQDRVPITLPDVTGVEEAPVSGCWVMP